MEVLQKSSSRRMRIKMVSAPLYLDQLPAEVLHNISIYLDHTSVQRLLQTSTRLCNVITSRRHVYARLDVDLTLAEIQKPKCESLQLTVRSRNSSGTHKATETARKPPRDLLGLAHAKKESSLDAAAAYCLPLLLSQCNPVALCLRHCSDEVLVKVADVLEKKRSKVKELEIHTGTATPTSVLRLLNSCTPTKVTVRAETFADVSEAMFATESFKSALEIDVDVFHINKHPSRVLDGKCLLGIKARSLSINVPFTLNTEIVNELVKGFLRFDRSFDSNLGWTILANTRKLSENIIFDGVDYKTKTLYSMRGQITGKLFEVNRGEDSSDRLRIMWNSSTLFINGVLSSLRQGYDYI